MGEIDIIATRKNILALIEVKARASLRDAAESIGMHQRERLQRAIGYFLAHHPHFSQHNVRFDLMLVAPYRWPVHIEDAWRPEMM